MVFPVIEQVDLKVHNDKGEVYMNSARSHTGQHSKEYEWVTTVQESSQHSTRSVITEELSGLVLGLSRDPVGQKIQGYMGSNQGMVPKHGICVEITGKAAKNMNHGSFGPIRMARDQASRFPLIIMNLLDLKPDSLKCSEHMGVNLAIK